MSTKDEVHHTDAAVVRPSKKRKCGAHCKRFWWVYLIVAIIVIVLVVCLVIFVGVPKIAQSKLNEAKLEIQGVNILETESDGYLMEVNSTISTDGSIHAEVDGFEGAMYLTDLGPEHPFATLDFPATSAKKLSTVNVSQEVTITDMDAFTTFNIWFVNNETLSITIEGKTKVKPSGLNRKYDVDFKKTLDVHGLNLFKGTEVIVDTAEVALEEDDEGKNFYGEADIPNASHFTLEVGNVAFANFIEDEEVGTLWIDNLLLHPGSNVVNITGNLRQTRVLSLLRTPDYCETGIIPFKLLGENVTRDGQDLSYFAAGLGSSNQTVDINIGAIIENSLGTSVGCASDSDD